MASLRTTTPLPASSDARAVDRAIPVNPRCPVCHGAETQRSFEARDPHYGNAGSWWERECRHCRSLFLDPLPTPEQIDGFYPEEEYYAYRPAAPKSALSMALRRLVGFRPGTREPSFDRPGSVLDFGCGAGDFLIELRERGWDCHGVELNAGAIAAARGRGLDVRRSIDGPDGYADAAFDYVRANHSLEHVLDPRTILSEMYRVLKPGGTLFIGVPTRDGLPAKVFGRYWWYLGAPVHPVTFSTSGLVELLRSVGFCPTRVGTNSDYGSTAGSLQIFLNRHTPRRSSDGLLFRFKPALLLGHWIARALDPVGLGDKLEVVAVKPGG
jgi:SAM-dependent methyltransferase